MVWTIGLIVAAVAVIGLFAVVILGIGLFFVLRKKPAAFEPQFVPYAAPRALDVERDEIAALATQHFYAKWSDRRTKEMVAKFHATMADE